MSEEVKILDQEAIAKALTRLAHEILERNKNEQALAIVGIRSHGVYLAERLADIISGYKNFRPPVGVLDITLYRDDLSTIADQPVLHKTEIDFDVMDKAIILVDDVLYTGRTVRAALNALIDFGRPLSIQLAVLIDRGHRELPIRADYVGKNIPTSVSERVDVRLTEAEGKDEVVVLREEPSL